MPDLSDMTLGNLEEHQELGENAGYAQLCFVFGLRCIILWLVQYGH